MAHDEILADRVREVLQDETGVVEKRMFGGLAFLVGGHIACAVSGRGGLMARVDPAGSAGLVDDVHVRRMAMGGRELDGWLRVDVEALDDQGDLETWVRRGLDLARALPPT